MNEFNAYEDMKRAEAYSRLEFPGTYYLAYRDLPRITLEFAHGKKALDFGCGAGRSTRFLEKYGFSAIGVDISASMLKKAREMDPNGNYLQIDNGDFSVFNTNAFDVIQSIFTFDNIPGWENKIKIFSEMNRMLKPDGIIINLVSSPEIYFHEWASFSTKDYPENKSAKCGEIVNIINTDIADSRPVEDIIWPDENYRQVYDTAGLKVIHMEKPLIDKNAEEFHYFNWINETEMAPWVIYVLMKK